MSLLVYNLMRTVLSAQAPASAARPAAGGAGAIAEVTP